VNKLKNYFLYVKLINYNNIEIRFVNMRDLNYFFHIFTFSNNIR